MDTAPELVNRLAPPPARPCVRCMHYCDPETNVWSATDKIIIEAILQEHFYKLDGPQGDALMEEHGLTKGDRHHLRFYSRIYDDVPLSLSRLLDKELYSKLDASQDTFAFTNCVLDFNSLTFRPISREDFVSTTTGWAYQAADASTHRAELERFLEMLMPVSKERFEALSYVASLMSGRRCSNRFLGVVGDCRGHITGKSSFVMLLHVFFGNYATTGVDFVGSRFERFFRGKRLITQEYPNYMEPVSKKYLRKYTSATDVLSRDGSFTWQAGFVFALDKPYLSRLFAVGGMIVTPFLGNVFTSRHTDFGTALLKSWCSAFADVLIEVLRAARPTSNSSSLNAIVPSA